MSRSPVLPLMALTASFGLSFALAEDPPRSLDDVAYEGVIDRGTPIDVDKMLQIWGSKLGTLIVADPSIAGVRVRFVQSDITLTWGLFKQLLAFHGVAIEERQSNGRWILLATRRGNLPPVQQPATPIVGAGAPLPPREEIVTAILQVTHGSAPDIFQNLRQIQAIRDQNRVGSMLYVRGPEAILIVDFVSSVEYYSRLVRAMDVRAPGQVTRVFHVSFAPVDEAARVLVGLLPKPGANVPGIGQTGTLAPSIIPDLRTNKLFVQCYADQLDEIQWMLSELDVKAQTRETTRHFYACRFADANYLAQKLSEIFGTAGPTGASRRPSKDGKAPVAPAAPGPTSTAAAKDVSAIETRIVADERSNALIITAEDNVYREILEVLEGTPARPGLDRAARRVLIEVQIWEIATPTDNLQIGFELEGLQTPRKGQFLPVGGTSFGLSQTQFDPTTGTLSRTPNLGANGFVAALTKDRFDRLPIILHAIASLEKTRLVTTPFAVTNDNEEVKFSSGTSTAYVKNTYGSVGPGIGATSVEYADATTDLTVRPQVHSDQSLTLEVSVHLKSIAGTGGPGLPPTLDTRSYDGVVTVPNMKYVVFGGLENETSNWSEDKVPLVGDVPILGNLFKNKQWTKSRARIYIFIRPTILGDDDRGWARLTQELREKAHVEAERDEWVPEIASEWIFRAPDSTMQDRLFEIFGTGSGCPFSSQPQPE